MLLVAEMRKDTTGTSLNDVINQVLLLGLDSLKIAHRGIWVN